MARELYAQVGSLPLICPHGHVSAELLADDQPFDDPVSLLISPDHYLTRMLYSQGIDPSLLGVSGRGTAAPVDPVDPVDPRAAWRTFCAHWHLFRGTPSRVWLEQSLEEVFGVPADLSAASADAIYDALLEKLASAAFRPRALFDSFNIEVLATTDAATDDLRGHARLAADGYGRVIPTFRPDQVVDPDNPQWARNVELLGALTGEDTSTYVGYLAALRARRQVFIAAGGAATDHGHLTASTADLDHADAAKLFDRLIRGRGEPGEPELFRAQMLTEFAAMSIDDGLVMQLHPGALRDHVRYLRQAFGPDSGGDIPITTEYTKGLRPLLSRFGADHRFRLVLYTLDETTYSRELAPLAGVYPSVYLGSPWWFFDSPEGMRRYRRLTTETAGFYNTVGFTDDTRALPSIPVRHDVARRLDCGFLAELVVEHRLTLDEAADTAIDMAYRLAKSGYRLDRFAAA